MGTSYSCRLEELYEGYQVEEIIDDPEPLGGPKLLWVVRQPSVGDSSAATLLPLIQQYVLPGSILAHTPQYTHHTVNHSENFVNQSTSVHTQGIEGSWKHC